MLGAQIQGAIDFGISNALFSKITLKDGRVEQGNFDSYPVLRLAGARAIEVHILPSTGKPTCVGEEGTPTVTAALEEAVHAACGPHRPRQAAAEGERYPPRFLMCSRRRWRFLTWRLVSGLRLPVNGFSPCLNSIFTGVPVSFSTRR